MPSGKLCYKEKRLIKVLKQTRLALLRSGRLSLCRPGSEEQSSQLQASDSWYSCLARGRAEAKVALGALITELG